MLCIKLIFFSTSLIFLARLADESWRGLATVILSLFPSFILIIHSLTHSLTHSHSLTVCKERKKEYFIYIFLHFYQNSVLLIPKPKYIYVLFINTFFVHLKYLLSTVEEGNTEPVG